MKHLQRLFVLLIVSAAIFSCQKEYSIEVPPGSNSSLPANWEFKEAGVQFKGPVDSVAIDTISTYTFLTINGRSDDGTTIFTLQAFGSTIAPGSYKTPFSLLAYVKGTTPIYQTDQAATDSFTIVITKFDSTSITGTFSGLAKTGNVGKTITDGKFTAPLKIKPPSPPTTTDSGQVVLWSKGGCGGTTNPISVSVGTKSGQITQFLNIEPTTCDPAGSFSVKLPVGTYPVVAKCGTDSFSTTITVQKSTCTKVQVDVSGVVANADYFPTTKGSNWSYSTAGGAADDTLYVLSTGNSKTFGASTYNIFINNYGASGSDSSYYKKDAAAGFYYEYYPASYNAFGLDTPATAVEHIFLKDKAAVATGWLSSYSGTYQSVAVTATIQDTLVQRLSTYTVGANSYPDVLEVHSGYYATLPAPLGKQELFVIRQWFAKGVGLIKYYQYDITGNTESTINLTRSKVY